MGYFRLRLNKKISNLMKIFLYVMIFSIFSLGNANAQDVTKPTVVSVTPGSL